jgi:hypothetical protein
LSGHAKGVIDIDERAGHRDDTLDCRTSGAERNLPRLIGDQQARENG